jgi:5-amino-6-(5-phosphoribosylamino)uracil reductase
VAERPYTILSCGMSLDGYLDAADHGRLVLSNEADLERVDAVRAECDAILVGAATVRNDNPRLLVRNEALRRPRRLQQLLRDRRQREARLLREPVRPGRPPTAG